MLVFFGTMLGLCLAMTFVLFDIAMEGSEAGIEACFVLLVPLALIWFPDDLGFFTGRFLGFGFDHESSSIAVSLIGWLLLIGTMAFWFISPWPRLQS